MLVEINILEPIKNAMENNDEEAKKLSTARTEQLLMHLGMSN
jgi:hypothetical protein